MRPPHVHANVTDEQYHDLIASLHGQCRAATRAVMVLLSVAGMSAADIAGLLHYSPTTVRRWIARHDSHGVAALADRPRSGRPRSGSPRIGQRIHTLLNTPKAWTTARVWRALGRPAISLRTVYRRVREQATWRRPRLIAKGDPDHDHICAAIAERITALPAGSVVLAEDETHLDLLARVRACWIPTGLRHRVMTPGSNVRRTPHGAVDLATGAWHHHVSDKNVSAVFCYFLDKLLAAYPDAPVVAVICDNGSTHHSGITRRWLAEHPRLQLITAARYSPQDNPVERIWAALKQHIANTAPATMADRVRQAHAFFRHRTQQQNLTTAAPWTSPWLPEGYGQDFWSGAYLRHGPALLAYAEGLLGDRQHAEETVQDTLLAIWRGAGSFQGRSTVRTWLFGICRRQALRRPGVRGGPPHVPVDVAAGLAAAEPCPPRNQLIRERESISSPPAAAAAP